MRILYGRLAAIKVALVALFMIAFAALLLFRTQPTVEASAFGPSPSFTNAPGEGNCTACHFSFPVNTGTGNVRISGIPHDYLPGQQIDVTVTTTDADAVVYGFQMTAVDNQGRQAGSFTVGPGVPAQTLIRTGTVSGNTRQYIEHTSDGIIPTVLGSKSWTFKWTAPAQRVGKIDFYAAGNGANSDGGPGLDQIYTKSTSALAGSAVSNFTSDLQSDLAVYRPSNGGWYSMDITSGTIRIVTWGLSQDIIAPGDYDGDGVTDRGIFRPSTGTWYLLKSTEGISTASWGLNGDIPAAGDYDGDGKTDMAVYRPSNGGWYVMKSTGGFTFANWGVAEDKPVPADYDADGKTDIAVFRPSTGAWYILKSGGGITSVNFGVTGDKPVQGDYDGDGKADLAIFRPSTGAWWLSRSSLGVTAISFGLSADVPAPADFDADGKTDLAVFRPTTGTWYITKSTDSSVIVASWGSNGDRPVPNGYIPE